LLFFSRECDRIVAIENGGTNASNDLSMKINLILGNVDNTSDVLKPVSSAKLTKFKRKFS
jgi:predicted Fe-Mo cluster-binding NifX family protein